MIYIIFSGLCPSLSGEGKFLCLDAVSSIRKRRIPLKIHAQISDNVRMNCSCPTEILSYCAYYIHMSKNAEKSLPTL